MKGRPKEEAEAGSENDELASSIADQLVETKAELVKLGRKVFQLSSKVASVQRNDGDYFAEIPADHPMFGRETVTETELNEFYKASEGYVALLKQLNIQLLKLSGKLKSDAADAGEGTLHR